jgi:hypothetical protein
MPLCRSERWASLLKPLVAALNRKAALSCSSSVLDLYSQGLPIFLPDYLIDREGYKQGKHQAHSQHDDQNQGLNHTP